MEIVKKIQLKIVIFSAVKNPCILHGRVFVMENACLYLILSEIPELSFIARRIIFRYGSFLFQDRLKIMVKTNSLQQLCLNVQRNVNEETSP